MNLIRPDYYIIDISGEKVIGPFDYYSDAFYFYSGCFDGNWAWAVYLKMNRPDIARIPKTELEDLCVIEPGDVDGENFIGF